MGLNKKAWAILLEDEKMVLNLQHGHNKSSWAAGELMNKAHYKLLEIKYRAECFLKLFTTHFNLYDNLVPEDIPMQPWIRAYFVMTIEKRGQVKDAYNHLNSLYGLRTKEHRNQELIDFIRKNEKSPKLENENFVNLVKEFDRWNNFRILPKEVQEPSAYKRRNKNLHRKHIRVMTKLSPLAQDILRKTLFCKSPTGKYVVILPEGKDAVVCNLRVRMVPKCTELGFYIWNSSQDAKAHAELLANYLEPKKRTCKEGLDFWPEFREHIKKAANYEQLQNIKPNRRFLEMAVSKLEFYNR